MFFILLTEIGPGAMHKQSTGLSHCSKQPQTWLEPECWRNVCTCTVRPACCLLRYIYYLLSTLCIYYLPMVLNWSSQRRWWVPGSQDTASLHWSPDLVTWWPWARVLVTCSGARCPHVSCHTGAGLRTRRWTGGDWWRAGAGPRRHRPLLRCTVTPAYTALALSTLHYWYTLHYGASTQIGGRIIP